MGFFHSLFGSVRVKLVSADLATAMSRLNESNIILKSVSMIDPLTIEFLVQRRDFKKLKHIANANGYTLHVERLEGLYWVAKQLLRRPVLIIGLVIILGSVCYVPGRIFFVQVDGNAQIPTKLILEKASQCGIGFGASRREVRSEKMKNALLQSIPQLQWAGVNTSGCVATITVKEKTVSDQHNTQMPGIASIVAARDGIIQKCTITNGNALCSVGQAVKAGQLLVSGYTDCGISIRASRADAEIYALTDRHLTVKSAPKSQSRGRIIRTEKKYSIQIGKILINFFNNSGISDATCVKIYDKQEMTMPGGFVLPVSLVTQTCTYYEVSKEINTEESNYAWISESARTYLDSIMIAGQVIASQETGELSEDVYIFEADYTCYEMIGQVKQEEIIQ